LVETFLDAERSGQSGGGSETKHASPRADFHSANSVKDEEETVEKDGERVETGKEMMGGGA